MAKEICNQCMGTGNLPHYSHVANGVCFVCNGEGKVNGMKNGKDMFSTVYFAFGCDDRPTLLKVYSDLKSLFPQATFTTREKSESWTIETQEYKQFAFGISCPKAMGVDIQKFSKTVPASVSHYCIYAYERCHPELFPGDPIAVAELASRARGGKR